MTRRAPRACLLTLFLASAGLHTGCAGSWLRPAEQETSLEELAQEDSDYISNYTHPHGLNYVQVAAVSLATGLDGGGGDPAPSAERAAVLSEMNKRRVPNPNKWLASDDTALVMLRAFLYPGIQKGDRIDVEVRSAARSGATSLRNGWVLPARLTEMAVLGDQVRTGHELARCEGPILVDAPANVDSEPDGAYATRGRILGGAVATRSRPMGLVIDREHKSVALSQAIAKSINQRFYAYRDGNRSGVATAKTDEYIELAMHDRYKANVTRYVRVVRNLTVDETPGELQERVSRLRTQLLDPLTAAKSALRLEAIGSDQAVDALEVGAQSTDPEVRFYSAEALAYLDKTSGVEPLADAARNEPAFRVNALAALSAMDDIVAYDALRALLSVDSNETRYGAFRALWAMNPADPLVRGERLGDQFSYHVLNVDGPKMVHVTRSHRPEIVLFGADQRFSTPLVLDAGKNILINGMHGDEITLSRFAAGEPTEKRVTSDSVDEVIRAIVELGGAYPDVVDALRQAKQDGALATRFRVDALPDAGREYQRDDEQLSPEDAGAAPYEVATPLPDLFSRDKRTN